MQRTSLLHTILLLGTGSVALCQAIAPDREKMVSMYAGMCMTQSIEMPVPHGDADLKENPKLEAYCQCFAGKFADRAILRLKNPSAPPPPFKQSLAEERAMRNGCRQSLGLPSLVFPTQP
jgi:hypothetical protein